MQSNLMSAGSPQIKYSRLPGVGVAINRDALRWLKPVRECLQKRHLCTGAERTRWAVKDCLRLFQKASTKILLYLMAIGYTVAPMSKAPRCKPARQISCQAVDLRYV